LTLQAPAAVTNHHIVIMTENELRTICILLLSTIHVHVVIGCNNMLMPKVCKSFFWKLLQFNLLLAIKSANMYILWWVDSYSRNHIIMFLEYHLHRQLL